MMEVRWLTLVCLGLGASLAAGDPMENGMPRTPGDWICLTTAGGVNEYGGRVNFTQCGDLCDSKSGIWIGYIGVLVAVVFFGSNYVPVKKFDTGDGIFFQWMLCIGIWLVGLITNFIVYQPPFFIPAVLGGILWTTAQLTVVPIVKLIGLTMGLTVWGVSNMLSGWISGVFILKQTLNCPGLNYGGVGMVVIAVIVLAFVKSEGKVFKRTTQRKSSTKVDERTALLSEHTDSLEGSLREKMLQKKESSSVQNSTEENIVFSPPPAVSTDSTIPQETAAAETDTDYSWVDNIGKWKRRVLGFSLSIIAGLFYGFQFLPIQFMKLCNDGAHSCNDIDYFYGQMCGVLFASTFFMMVYSVIKRNRPIVYPRVVVPGILSGILWGIAMVGWFVANQHLSLGVSFPIICAGPGFVSSAWGILVFREIKGWKNITLYFVAFSISLGGLVMDGLSHCKVDCRHH